MNKYPLVIFHTEMYADVIFAAFRENVKIDLSIAKQIVENRLDFTKNEKHYLVIDMSKVKEVSREAKEFMQRPDTGLRNILGAAFIVADPVSVLMANIFMKTRKDFETKFFTNKENALRWIFECRKKINNMINN